MTLATLVHPREEIRERVDQLAKLIQADHSADPPLLVCVLKGSVVFLADLVRSLGFDPDIDFMSISSYGSADRTGVVRIVKDLEEPLEGRPVVVVEDIVDTGLTLSYLLRTLQTRGPASLKVCTLVNKTPRRIVELPIDYAGFESEDFLIGYGLDFKGRYRNLPDLLAIGNLPSLAENPDALVGELFVRSRPRTETV